MRTVFLIIFLSWQLTGCTNKPNLGTLKVIKGILLKQENIDYPSGSAMNFYRDSLYLMGDDARDLLVLDTGFNVKRSIRIFEGSNFRIRKAIKADIEATAIVPSKQHGRLLLIGSGSVPVLRDSLFELELTPGTSRRTSLTAFYTALKTSGIEEVNVEGATFAGKYLLLANRNNLKHKQNYLIVAPANLSAGNSSPVRLIPLHVSDAAYGVSGLDYYAEKDLLFITFSSEATQSASLDGKIGDSALGIISDFSKKLEADSLVADAWLPLPAIDPVFDGAKIESVAVEVDAKGRLLIYLVSDNDDGRTGLYKVELLF